MKCRGSPCHSGSCLWSIERQRCLPDLFVGPELGQWLLSCNDASLAQRNRNAIGLSMILFRTLIDIFWGSAFCSLSTTTEARKTDSEEKNCKFATEIRPQSDSHNGGASRSRQIFHSYKSGHASRRLHIQNRWSLHWRLQWPTILKRLNPLFLMPPFSIGLISDGRNSRIWYAFR